MSSDFKEVAPLNQTALEDVITWVNQLHYTKDERLTNFKTYYEFLHTLRNEQSHLAPEIKDSEVKPGIHMTVAMYLYATMINLKRLKSAGLSE